MKKEIIRITSNLLAAGAFRNLPDEEVSRIYFLLSEAQQVNFSHLDLMIRSWYRANFFSMGVPEFLLYECNACLLQLKLPIIEGWIPGYAA